MNIHKAYLQERAGHQPVCFALNVKGTELMMPNACQAQALQKNYELSAFWQPVQSPPLRCCIYHLNRYAALYQMAMHGKIIKLNYSMLTMPSAVPTNKDRELTSSMLGRSQMDLSLPSSSIFCMTLHCPDLCNGTRSVPSSIS